MIYEKIKMISLLIILLITALIIYILHFKELKKPSDYFIKAIVLNVIFNRKSEAESVINKLLATENLSIQNKYNALLYLGDIYYKLKRYDKSSQMFLSGLSMIEDCDFLYRDYFNTAIKALLSNGERQKAQDLYNNFLERQSYDKRFRSVRKIEKLFSKY